jgi:hypothetical protein
MDGGALEGRSDGGCWNSLASSDILVREGGVVAGNGSGLVLAQETEVRSRR